jgi:hypothetical protein
MTNTASPVTVSAEEIARYLRYLSTSYTAGVQDGQIVIVSARSGWSSDADTIAGRFVDRVRQRFSVDMTAAVNYKNGQIWMSFV